VTGKALAFGFEVMPLIMEKRLPIRDEELEVSDLRSIHCGIVNFSDDAVP
jgi:hypothetical protein